MESTDAASTFDPRPFTISVSEEVLGDLAARIRSTRWPPDSPDAPWRQGTDLGYLRELLRYWADGFDWHAQERWLNSFAHFVADSVSGFISCTRGHGPAAASRWS